MANTEDYLPSRRQPHDLRGATSSVGAVRSPTSLQAILLDFDGTIVDTETADFECWTEVYSQFGCTLPQQAYASAAGTSDGFDPIQYLSTRTGHTFDKDIVSRRWKTRFNEVTEQLPLAEGLIDLLGVARTHKLRVAIVSNSPPSWIANHLRRLRLSGEFDVIVNRNDVKSGKPDPHAYLVALRRLGITSDQALAVEDSIAGVHAGISANIFSVAVPNAVTRRLPFRDASARFESLASLALCDIINYD